MPLNQDKQHKKMAILSYLQPGSLYHQEIFLVLFSVRLKETPSYSAGGNNVIKYSNGIIGI